MAKFTDADLQWDLSFWQLFTGKIVRMCQLRSAIQNNKNSVVMFPDRSYIIYETWTYMFMFNHTCHQDHSGSQHSCHHHHNHKCHHDHHQDRHHQVCWTQISWSSIIIVIIIRCLEQYKGRCVLWSNKCHHEQHNYLHHCYPHNDQYYHHYQMCRTVQREVCNQVPRQQCRSVPRFWWSWCWRWLSYL